jgi:hypothetical protein
MSPGRYSTVISIQREEVWCRYKAADSVLKIAGALGQRTSNLYRTLLAAGGIEPARRTRSLTPQRCPSALERAVFPSSARKRSTFESHPAALARDPVRY